VALATALGDDMDGLGKQIRQLARELRALEDVLVRDFGLAPVSARPSVFKSRWRDALESLREAITDLLAPSPARQPARATAVQRVYHE